MANKITVPSSIQTECTTKLFSFCTPQNIIFKVTKYYWEHDTTYFQFKGDTMNAVNLWQLKLCKSD